MCTVYGELVDHPRYNQIGGRESLSLQLRDPTSHHCQYRGKEPSIYLRNRSALHIRRHIPHLCEFSEFRSQIAALKEPNYFSVGSHHDDVGIIAPNNSWPSDRWLSPDCIVLALVGSTLLRPD